MARRVHMYIKYIESATSGGAKKTGDRDVYISKTSIISNEI